MKTIGDLFKASEEIGQGDKSKIQGGREMTLVEAQKSISLMRGYVNQVLDYLQEQKFQKAVEDSLYIERHLLSNYDEAIDLLIERERTDLLEDCREIYKSACKAFPLLVETLNNYEKSGKRVGDTEWFSTVWSSHTIDFWERVVSPILHPNPLDREDPVSRILKLDAEARQREKKGDEKAEAPHRGRKKDNSILWLVENPDGHLGVLHQLTDGLRGVNFFCFIKAAVLEGWFNRPPYRVIKKEFGDIGSRSRYNFYMSNPYNEKELEQLRATLRLRHQNL